jgi:hypothetical protein
VKALILTLLLTASASAQITANGVPNQGITGVSPVQNRPAGSLTLNTAPDNLSGDRHVFNLRTATVSIGNEFDGSISAGSITCPLGVCTGTGYGGRYLFPSPYTSATATCYVKSGSAGGDLATCSPVIAGPAVYGATITGGAGHDFGYYDTSTFHTVAVVAASTTFFMWTVVNNGYSSVGLCPVNTLAGCITSVDQSTGAPALVWMQMQTGGNGGVSNFSYAADNVSGGSPLTPNMIAIPPTDGQVTQALPLQLQVPSNPAGSQVNFLVILPPNYNPTVSNPWVMWMQGDGGSVFDIFNIAVDTQMAQGLSAAGYTVIATDYTSNSCWGNAACVSDIQTAVSSALLQFNLDPIPYCYAGSMGGMVMLNAISHGTLKCRAAEMAFPAVNMSNIYAGGGGAFNSQLQTAYSCASPTTCNAAFLNAGGVPYDPMTIGMKVFSTTPMDVRCSASDATISCSNNGQALVTAVNAVGGSSVFTSCTGAHGDPSCVLPAAAVDFFKQH